MQDVRALIVGLNGGGTVYELSSPDLEEMPDEIEQFYDDPRLLERDLTRLRKRFPHARLLLKKNDLPLEVDELEREKRDFEIRLTMTDIDRVPSGYRRAWGADGDDIGNGISGPVGVWRPKNPED